MRRMAGDLPSDWAAHVASTVTAVDHKGETIATRKASQNSIEAYAPKLPELLGGSADLAGSNLTLWSGAKGVSREAGATTFTTGCVNSAWRRSPTVLPCMVA